MQFSWLIGVVENTEGAGRLKWHHQWLPYAAGTATGRCQNASRGPFRNVVINLGPCNEVHMLFLQFDLFVKKKKTENNKTKKTHPNL